MAELKNEFSWSKSRADKFKDCRRAYYYHYYGSWGGWDLGSPELARELYILKNLSGRHAWAGSVVHDTIAWVLNQYKDGTVISCEDAIARARAEMVKNWRHSVAKGYRQEPKTFGLFEHEYTINVAREKWQENYANVERCLRNFYLSPIFASIRSTPPEYWLPIEKLDRFDFEGTPIWVVMDFAMRDREGNILIVDWKTGKNKAETDMVQLFCYSLYAQTCYGVDLNKVACRLEYLATQESSISVMDPARVEFVREAMRQSIASMRASLRIPEENLAVEDDFPKITNDRQCYWCTYRKVCKPHIV